MEYCFRPPHDGLFHGREVHCFTILVFQINPRHSHYPWPLKDPEILFISICLKIYKLKMSTHWKQFFFFFRLLRNLNFGNRKHLLFKIYVFLKEKRNCHLHGSFKFHSTYFQFDMPIIKTIINPWHLFTTGWKLHYKREIPIFIFKNITPSPDQIFSWITGK